MKTIPIARPGAGPEPTPDASVKAAQERRANAIAKLEGRSQPQNNQVPIPVNANAISAEDMSAVRPPSLQPTTNVESTSAEPVDTKVTTEQVREASKPADQEPSQSQLAVLARKERALRAKAQQQEQALRAKEQQWLQEKQQLEQRLQELEQGYIPKSSLKQAAFEALHRGELSYDEITQEVMNPMDYRSQQALQRLEARIAEQDKRLAAYEKGAQEAQTQQYQAALKQIKTDVQSLVKVDPSFEMIKATNSTQDVVDLIEQTFKEDGYVMTVEEAAQEVENYLVEEASKLARIEKIKKKVSPPQPSVVKKAEGETGATQTPQTKQTQPMKTLTNATSGSRKLSARERALLAFKGELKS